MSVVHWAEIEASVLLAGGPPPRPDVRTLCVLGLGTIAQVFDTKEEPQRRQQFVENAVNLFFTGKTSEVVAKVASATGRTITLTADDMAELDRRSGGVPLGETQVS